VVIADAVAALGLRPLDELKEYLTRQSLWYLNNVDRANIFFTESRNLTGDRRDLVRERGIQFEKHMRDLIEVAQKEGQVRSQIDARLLSRFVIGSLNNVRRWPSHSLGTFTNEQLAATLIELIFNGLDAQPSPIK